MPPDDFSKSLGVNVKANFDATGFEKGSERVVVSAERQATALQNLRKSTEELQRLQTAYTKTPEVFAQQREEYKERFGGRGASLFSKEAEKLHLESLKYQIESAGGQLPSEVIVPEELEKRELSTNRLRGLVEDKFSQFGGMTKTQRKALLADVRPHTSELQRRYGSTQQYYAEKVREATAEFEGMSGTDQLKNLDSFNEKIQKFEENGRKARVAAEDLAKSTKKFTEEAGAASKALPAYAASVINMGVTIGQGIAQISRAGALAFDYSSPMAMHSAQEQFEIQKSKTMWSTGGSVAGQILGAGLGMFTGINPFAASYIGGMIGGGAGDIIGTFLNIEPEKQLKYMSQMYSKTVENVNRSAAIQEQEYGLARRTGATPEQVAEVLKKYSGYGIDQTQAAQIANQYVSSTGRMNVGGLDQWLSMYQRTGTLPTGAGAFEKLTGRGGVNIIAGAGLRMGLTQENGNLARYEDMNQYFQQATSVAGKLFNNSRDIERSTSMTANLPYTLYGENVKGNDWATSLSGMQQIGQGFQALGQSKNGGEQAFLFNALGGKGQNWRETLLRMQEGIYGKGNLQDILSYTKKAYGGRGGDALFSMLSDKGVSPAVIRDLVKQFETDSSGLISRLGGDIGSEKDLMDRLGKPMTSPISKIKAWESISETESARGVSESFTKALAEFNVNVAGLASSPEMKAKMSNMFDEVFKSIEEAFKPVTKYKNDDEKKEREQAEEFDKQHPGGIMQTLKNAELRLAGGKTLNLAVDTTVRVINSIPQSNNRSMVPSQP
jgi:hypothetical protein